MLSLIVPIRDWPQERLNASLASFARMPAEVIAEMIVVDFGSAAPVVLDGADPRARVLRLEAKVWSSSEAVNAGVLAAKGEIIAKADSDILLGPQSLAGLRNAAADIASGHYAALIAQATDLPPELDVAAAAEAICAGRVPRGRLRAKWGQGGLILFSRTAWAGIGGYDSHFINWGGEDNDFPERLRQAGSRIGWLDRRAVRIFHIWHPPQYHRTDLARQREANAKLLARDKSVFRPLRFLHSDPTPIAAPKVVRGQHPFVTIAVASTGRPGRDRMIREAIDSFKGQIDNDFEIVVVDNGSNDDDFKTLATSLKTIRWDANIRLERVRDGSIPGARNEIARLARGRHICVADDDDLALPNRLADHLRPFTDNGLLHGTHGGWIDFDEDTGLIERNGGKHRTVETLLKGRGKITAHPSSFYRTDVMRAVRYDESFTLGSDWDLALRMGALGLSIAHTGSFVTLRRFHSANVTLTGTSRQVTNGLRSRTRTTSLYGSRARTHIATTAPSMDAELGCYNDLSIEGIVALLPEYVGVWRLLLPFGALQDAEGDNHPTRPSRLERLLALVDGDVSTQRAGVNQMPIFCSEPIKGAKTARTLAKALKELTGTRPTLLADRQFELDRAEGFDWKSLEQTPGAAILVSQRFAGIADALVARSRLPAQSLLEGVVNLVSDYDAGGEAHYLATSAIQTREAARALQTELQALTGATFTFERTANTGKPSDIGDRQH